MTLNKGNKLLVIETLSFAWGLKVTEVDVLSVNLTYLHWWKKTIIHMKESKLHMTDLSPGRHIILKVILNSVQ